MTTEIPAWLLASAPPTVIAALLGAWVGVKYLRNGKQQQTASDSSTTLPQANCPGKPYFEERKIEVMRQEEAFRSMIVSWDRNAEASHELAKSIRETGEEQTKAIIRLAELAAKRREGNG